jgi:hypothetical protein
MSHETFREKLLDLAYGELSPRDARRVEAHARECAACGAELARIRETRRAMSALPDAPAPDAGEAVLLAAARESARSRARPRRLLPAWTWGAAAAAVALLAVGAISYRILAMRPHRAEDPDALLGREGYASAPAVAPEPEPEPAPTPAPAPAPAPTPREARESVEPGRAADSAVRAEPPAAAKAPRARGEGSSRKASPPPAPVEDRAQPPAAAVPDDAAAGARSRQEAIGIEDRAPAPSSAASPEAPSAPAAPAPAPATSGPSASASASASRPRAAAPSAAPRARQQAPESAELRALAAPTPGAGALARYQALRQAGRLRGEVVTFESCEGERWRKVETDPEGRVVRYARHGVTAAGAPFEAELYFGEGGALDALRYREGDGPWAEDASGAGVRAAVPDGVREPARATGATAGAPPRCRPPR